MSPCDVSDTGSDTLTSVSLSSDVSRIRQRTPDVGDVNDDCDTKKDVNVECIFASESEKMKKKNSNKIPNNDNRDSAGDDKRKDSMGKEERSRKYVAEFLDKYVLKNGNRTTVDSVGGNATIKAELLNCSQSPIYNETKEDMRGREGGAGGGGMGSGGTVASISHKLGVARNVLFSGVATGLSTVGDLYSAATTSNNSNSNKGSTNDSTASTPEELDCRELVFFESFTVLFESFTSIF